MWYNTDTKLYRFHEASCSDIINNGQVMKKLNSKENNSGLDDVDMQWHALLLQKP